MYNKASFQSGVIRPVECFKEGWHLIKDQYWLFLGLTFVTMMLGSAVPLGIIMGAMICGLYTCLFNRMRGETVSFDMLFKGFDHFVQSLIATLAQMVPAIIIMVPFTLVFVFGMTAAGRQTDPNKFFPQFLLFMALFFVAMMAFAMIFGIIVVFTYPLIVDRGLPAIDALKTSAKAAFANLGGMVGLLLLNMLFSLIGVAFCYVGCFFVMPVSFAAFAVAYRKVFPEYF